MTASWSEAMRRLRTAPGLSEDEADELKWKIMDLARAEADARSAAYIEWAEKRRREIAAELSEGLPDGMRFTWE